MILQNRKGVEMWVFLVSLEPSYQEEVLELPLHGKHGQMTDQMMELKQKQ
jgi:hypothetical protein